MDNKLDTQIVRQNLPPNHEAAILFRNIFKHCMEGPSELKSILIFDGNSKIVDEGEVFDKKEKMGSLIAQMLLML
jgi:hypothetical protein